MHDPDSLTRFRCSPRPFRSAPSRLGSAHLPPHEYVPVKSDAGGRRGSGVKATMCSLADFRGSWLLGHFIGVVYIGEGGEKTEVCLWWNIGETCPSAFSVCFSLIHWRRVKRRHTALFLFVFQPVTCFYCGSNMAAAVLGGGVYLRKEGGQRHEGGFLLVSHTMVAALRFTVRRYARCLRIMRRFHIVLHAKHSNVQSVLYCPLGGHVQPGLLLSCA